jgi:hypothetical protein
MFINTGEKLASIQNKIHTIQDRLEANKYYDDEEAGCCGVSPKSWKEFLGRQTFYAHLLKLITLFSIAVAHLVYMQSFLDSYSALEDYSQKLIQKYPTQLQTPHGLDTRVVQHQLNLLADYKKNVWMTVGAMCVALSTSCFFLFLLPISQIRRININIMKIIDFIAFASIPMMLLARSFVAEAVRPTIQNALQTAHKIASADKLMNSLVCSIHYRENLPYCSDLILESIFPVVLLKYLLILTILTLAYIALAYLIEWCIRHWFPPSLLHQHTCSHPDHHHHHHSHHHHQQQRHVYNKVYMPVILPPKNPLLLDA